jgi:hypothetical protein
MRRLNRLLAMAGILVTVAACEMAPQEEYVVAEPEPISVSRAFSGKF